MLWRPGITTWINVWGNDHDESAEERLSRIRADRSPDGFNEVSEEEKNLLRYAYRLSEDPTDQRVAALYAFAIGLSGHVQIAIYFDTENALPYAEQLWRSLEEHVSEYQG